MLNIWITSLIIAIILSTLVELIAPESSLKPFINLSLGFVIIAIMLRPIIPIGTNTIYNAINDINVVAESTQYDVARAEADNDAKVKAAFAQGLQNDILARYGVHAQVSIDDNFNITNINVTDNITPSELNKIKAAYIGGSK
ncbi:MAG: stage III sporulation protein AF [Clostridiales bacterium]|jgi:stage III sporulation protein AF|nr:stage III sporulation protein AF [Clostridiales bacterium]